MKFICKLSLVLFGLIIVMCLPFIQVQAAEDELQEYEFCLSFYINKTDGSTDEYGGNPFSVSGKDIKVYSLGSLFPKDTLYGERMSISLTCYAFSPFPFVHSLSTSECNKVEIDGKTIYYRSIYGFMIGHDLNSFDSFTYSGVPNVTMYSEDKDLDAIAQNIAEEMAAAGFYDYDDSQWATDRPEFNPDTSGAKIADFGLSDFTFWRDDTFIYASWSGLTDYLGNEDITNDFVFVSAGFLESGSSVSKDIGYYHLADGLLKIPFSRFTGSDTGILSMIKLVPYHYALSDKTVLCKGRSSNEYFNDIFYDDEWGTYYDPDCFLINSNMNYTKGTSALSGTLSTFMGKELNNGFYSYSSRNMRYLLTWEDVNTTYEADLTSSYMRIDIICNGQEYVFSDSSYPLSSKNIDISLSDILSLLQEKGVQPVIETFSIKYTPYYMVGRKTYHGRSIRFIVEANSAGVLQISQGDDSFENDSDYFDVDIVQPDDLPVVIPGFTDDESFEFDFSYDADNMFKNFFNSLRSLISYCGQIPALINKVFSFLPSVYGDMIVIILAACFIMRLLGR